MCRELLGFGSVVNDSDLLWQAVLVEFVPVRVPRTVSFVGLCFVVRKHGWRQGQGRLALFDIGKKVWGF